MRKVLCPNCRKETVYSKDNPFRPFCSERCKLIDLGEWADGKYAIPDTQTPPFHPDQDTDEET